MRLFRGLAVTLYLLAICGSAARAIESQPLRHLVYAFDITIASDMTVKDSGIGNGDPSLKIPSTSGSGTNHYGGGASDKGTITVDVVEVQSDTGTVVRISEQARDTRSAEAATCVVYGIGAVICDTSKKINEEEMALLRLLGHNFVNPEQIDAKHHWRYAESNAQAKETNDYTIVGERGDVAQISLQRMLDVSGAQGYNATTNGQLLYDREHAVPRSLKEETITRQHVGMGQDNRVDQQLTLTLQTDSLAAAGVH
jgi:hypothetical protein